MKKSQPASPPARPSPALAHWLARLEQLDPARITLGLERVLAVRQRLPDNASEHTILIGGTNGKGSCALLIERLLRASGHSVGRYTSPHLCRFNERIVVDGREVDDGALVAAFEQVERARGDVALSYFEFTTLAALVVFADAGIDARVLEIGLGGRLDAVNVEQPDACLLTNVGLDHQDWLGEDVETIGHEKAAIFRAAKPAVIASRTPPASVLADAQTIGATVLRLGCDFDHALHGAHWTWHHPERRIEGLPATSGEHQRDNASACLALLQSLGLLAAIDDAAVGAAIAAGNGPGRLERIPGQPELLLDVAHNVDAVARLADWLAAHPLAGPNTLVFGAMRDKAVEDMLAPLAAHVGRWIAVQAPGRRPLEADALAQRITRVTGAPVMVAGSPVAGFRAARRLAGAGGRIVVAGSFPVVGAVRGQL